MTKGILFVGHGSKLEAGNEEVRQFVKQITPLLSNKLLVETCFLEFAEPSISKGIDLCVEKGVTDLYVIPIILLHAGHSKIHIPIEIVEAQEKYPNVKFTYGEVVGIHDEVFHILIDRLKEMGFVPENTYEDTAILLIARGGSDPNANGDFYKITRLLWEKLKVKYVESVFMGVTNPRVEEGIERCIKLGAKKIIMLPYFLFTGILMERMNGMCERFNEQYPDVEFEIAHYFGYHPCLKTVLLNRIEEAQKGLSKGYQDLSHVRELMESGELEHHHHHHDHEDGHHHHEHDETKQGVKL
jgi:sirohydrochlorin cobaltochelatase